MQPTATVLVYSDDSNTREQVRLAPAAGPSPDVPGVEFLECATLPAVLRELDRGGIDVVRPGRRGRAHGRHGLCRQIKDEMFRCPPVLVLIGPPAGRVAGDLEPGGRGGDAAGGPGGARRGAGARSWRAAGA